MRSNLMARRQQQQGLYASLFHMDKTQLIEYFNKKGYAITSNWDDLWQQAHAHAKTIAGETKVTILEEVFNGIEKGLKKNHNRRLIAQDIAETLAKKGWYYNHRGDSLFKQPALQAQEEAIKGNVNRLKLIVRQNAQSAYMSSAYKRYMDNVDDRPYWQYLAIMDGSTRHSHAQLHNKVFMYDNPIWDRIFPPNGFNCRCRVSTLSKRDMERNGLEVSTAEMTKKKLDKAVPEGKERYRYGFNTDNNPQKFWVDDGFAYNAGKEQAKPFIPSLGNITAENEHLLNRVIDSSLLLADELSPLTYAMAFLSEFDIGLNETKYFTDVTGEVIPISDDLLTKRSSDRLELKADKNGRGKYMKILAQTLKDPDEVWLNWEKEAGQWVLKRHYIKVMDLGNNLFALGVFKREQGVWYGSTVFQLSDDMSLERMLEYLAEKRKGILLYKNNEDKKSNHDNS